MTSIWRRAGLFPYIVLGAAFVGVALSSSGGGWLVALGLAVALTPWLVVATDYQLLALAVVVAYSADWLALQMHLVPSQAPWVFEIALAVLLLRAVARRRGKRLGLPTIAWWYIGVIAAIALFALLMGTSALPVLLVGLRKYLRVPLLGAVVGAALAQQGSPRSLWRTLLVLGLVQLPVAAYQLVTYGGGDAVTGTIGLGGSGLMGLFLSMLACVVLVSPAAVGRRWVPLKYLVGFGLLAPLGPAGSTLPLLMTPGGLAVGSIAQSRTSRSALAYSAIALLLVLAAAPFILDFTLATSGVNLTRFTSVQGALQYDSASNSRIGQVLIANRLVSAGGPATVLFGYGPGSASRSSLGDDFSGGLYRRLPSVRLITTSLGTGILETGYVGVAAGYALMLFAMWYLGRTLVTCRSEGTDALVLLGIVAAAYLCVAAAYNEAWTQPVTALPLWIALGAAHGVQAARHRES